MLRLQNFRLMRVMKTSKNSFDTKMYAKKKLLTILHIRGWFFKYTKKKYQKHILHFAFYLVTDEALSFFHVFFFIKIERKNRLILKFY